MTRSQYSRSLAGVLAFSLFAGVISGYLVAASFMPIYSIHYNWRQWHPGTEEITVLGEILNISNSRVISVSGWDELRDAGMPSKRLWLYDAKTARQPQYALIAHGVWRDEKITVGADITLNLDTGPITIPVAGVWQPFHPQLGDNWVIMVGSAELPASGLTIEALGGVEKPAMLPPSFQGRQLLSWMLLNGLGFLLFGALGLMDSQGKYTTIGWALKLWVGAGAAILMGLLSAALVFKIFMPLPVLGLLPMTLGLLAASYLLAVLLLTGLSLILARWT